MLKIGDMLICHTAVVMEDNVDVRTTVGKSYKIIKFLKEPNRLAIENDYNEEHYFTFNEELENHKVHNYTHWFYNLRELRRKKLKKIKKEGLI